jgi:23S rRNA pseudouridine1911/1915/1917 synthase
MRLDRVLPGLIPGYTRSALVRFVKAGRVGLDGRPAKPSAIVRAGQTICFTAPPPEGGPLRPDYQVSFGVIYEDPTVLVVDKPAGLAVHPGPGLAVPTLAEGLLAILPGLSLVGEPGRPGIVHRLDKDTTGALLVAKSDEARASLMSAFAARTVRKRYLAFVMGSPPKAGAIDSPIGRHPSQRTRRAIGTPGAKEARTSFRTLRRFPATGLALLSVALHTGRTHQARVHLASQGLPILGDKVYGRRRAQRELLEAFPDLAPFAGRQLLHARRISFPRPGGAGRISVAAPWPEDFLGLFRWLRAHDP